MSYQLFSGRRIRGRRGKNKKCHPRFFLFSPPWQLLSSLEVTGVFWAYSTKPGAGAGTQHVHMALAACSSSPPWYDPTQHWIKPKKHCKAAAASKQQAEELLLHNRHTSKVQQRHISAMLELEQPDLPEPATLPPECRGQKLHHISLNSHIKETRLLHGDGKGEWWFCLGQCCSLRRQRHRTALELAARRCWGVE